ncbi:MAG TPA: capsule assembly Wzi family protein [bacterium]|nr:capsule assembly Wzi family protein [bacterium]
MKRLFPTLALAFFLVFLAMKAGAYSSVTVPIEDPVYRRIDKLVAFGLIKTQMIGQRPYVRAEIARLIAEAMEHYPAFAARFREDEKQTFEQSAKRLEEKVYVDKILKGLKADYRDELIQQGALEGRIPAVQGQIIDELRWDLVYLDQAPSFYPADNGFGGIEGRSRPLVQNRGGRHFVDGVNLGVETSHWFRFGKYFSVQGEPRFQVQVAKDDKPEENQVFVQRLSGRFTWNKLDLQIGRDSVNWGPSAEGGLGFSNNARPLDFVKLSSVSPFRYPFLFKNFGLAQWNLIVANLGPEQRFKDSWLVAYKHSMRASPYLEIGMSQSLVLGGDGAPDLGFGSAIGEFWGVGGHDQSSSNRNLDFDIIGSIPQLWGMQVYTQLNFEDFDRSFNVLFRDDLSFIAGVYLPRATRSGTLDLRVEYRRLSARYGRHPVFTSGMTENLFPLGDSMGPDSQSLRATMRYDFGPHTLIDFGIRYGRRSGDLYDVDYDTNGVAGRTTAVDRPTESRFRTLLGVRHVFDSHLTARFGFGWEGVKNFNFVAGDDANQWLAEAGFTYRFGPDLGIGRQP